MLKKIISASVAVSSLFAGVYIVPQEYDNMVNASKSQGFGVITQSTSQLSGNSYTIGGQSVQFRCLVVPKISCTSATPQINANISESSLKRPSTEELVSTFQTDLRVESDTSNWYLCGAGYGGQTWDDSNLTSKTVAGQTQVTYSYTPNSKGEQYYYFTNLSNASTQSYLTVTYNQVCQ